MRERERDRDRDRGKRDNARGVIVDEQSFKLKHLRMY